MSQKKKQITIVLPDCMADMPVRVVRGNECSEIIVDSFPKGEQGTCGRRNQKFGRMK